MLKKKLKQDNDCKTTEVIAITNFIKDELESFSYLEVYIDHDYDSDADRVIGFR